MDSLLDRSLDRSLDEARRGSIAYLLNQNLLDPAQYEPGGWLYENHSRASGAMVVNENGNVVWAPENLIDASEGSTVYWTRTGVTHVLTGATYEGRVVHQLTKTSAAGVNGHVSDFGQGGTLSENFRLYLSAKFEKTESPLIASMNFTNQGIASYYVKLDVSDGTIIDTHGTGGNHEVIDDGDWWLIRTPVENSGGTGNDFFSIRIDADEDAGAVLRFTQPMVSRGGFHEYIPSSGGNPTFAPRLQHDASGNPLGYLHEPQATNEVVESEDFSTWTATGLTATGGQADPTGGSDAYLLAETAASLVHFLFELSSIAAGEIAMSVFAKRATGGNYLQLRPHGIGSGKAHASFDLDAGTVYATGGTEFVDAYIESMAGGWYRCVLVGDYAVAPSSLSVVISNDGTERPAYTGNTSNAFYIFGAQMELGSRATSYIPTNGAAATRAGDDVAIGSVEFSSFWTGDPVTFVFHGSVLADENLNNRMVLSNASKSRRWCYANFPGRGNADEALVVYDGSSTPEIVDDVRLTTPFKYAIAIEAGQVRGSFNGGSVGTGVVNSNLLSSVSDFALFKDHGGVCALLRIIPGAVSDAQLQSLTAP